MDEYVGIVGLIVSKTYICFIYILIVFLFVVFLFVFSNLLFSSCQPIQTHTRCFVVGV